MKFQIEQKDLVEILTAIRPASETKADLPAYLCTQIIAEDGMITFNAFSMMLSMSAMSKDREVERPGVVGVASKSLYDVARVSEGLLTIEMASGSNRLHIKGKGSHFQLNTIAGDAFPINHNFSAIQWKEDVHGALIPLFRKVWFAAGKDGETKASLTGILIQDQQMQLPGEDAPAHRHVVCCDGHRLAIYPHEFSFGSDRIVPAESLKKVCSVLREGEALHFAASESGVLLSQKGIFAEIRCLDGGYPAYQQIIPKDPYDELIMNREALMTAFKKVTPMFDKAATVQMIAEDGVLTLISHSHELGKAEATCEVQMAKPFKIGFNAKYIEQVLEHLSGDNVTFRVRSDEKPVEIREDRYLHVIMPKRIGG